MSARRLVSGALPVLCVLVGGLVFLCGQASAAITHNLISRITEVPASSGASVTGPLQQPWGLAVDSGNLYLTDPFTATTDEFDPTGGFVSQIAVGRLPGSTAYLRSLAVNHTSGEVYVGNAESGKVDVFSSAGVRLGEWTGGDTPSGAFNMYNSLSVGADNSTNLSDPAAGEVYVADQSHEVVDVFRPEAGGKEKYVTEITGSSQGPFTGVSGIAVDEASGDVYVVDELSYHRTVVDIFKPIALNQYEYLSQLTGPPNGEFAEIGGVAIDPVDGDVYVSDNTAATVEEFSSTEGYLGHLVGGPEAPFTETMGIAVDAGENLYVAEGLGGAVDVFGAPLVIPDVLTNPATALTTTTATLNGSVNPDGTSVIDCEFEYGSEEGAFESKVPCSQTLPLSGESPVAVSAEVTGLTVGTPYHYRVVATNANGTNTAKPVEFETLTTAPSVESESADEIGNTVATLHARINQHKAATTYHFEYGLTSSYGASVPIPDRAIGSAVNETTVGQVATGLQAGSTYHYRVVATNSAGATDGPDETFETFAVSPVGETGSCPNAALRAGGLSTGLPDCRAYEMVSPLDKNGVNVNGQGDSVLASTSGEQVMYEAVGGFGNTIGSGSTALVQYVAFRGETAWSTDAITPTPANSALQLFGTKTVNRLFSTDFANSVVEGYVLPDAEPGVPGAQNFYLENTKTQRLETLTKPQEGTTFHDPQNLENKLRGASGDLGVVVFESSENLLTRATGSNPKLYAIDHGTLQLAGVLPDGTIPSGGSSSVYESEEDAIPRHEGVSADGSRIFFMSPADGSSAPQLYVRENEERTAWISRSEASTPDPEPQNVKFQGATPDGSKVLFSTSDRLLDGDPGGPGYAIYLYTNSPDPETESNLTFIGRFTSPEVVGMSIDAKRIYFDTEEEGFPLYLWDEGVTRKITQLHGNAKGIEGGNDTVSADGERLAFLMGSPSTGRSEMYLYNAPSKTLKCVSCPAKNTGAMQGVEPAPNATKYLFVAGQYFRHQFMSGDGHYVFFATPDALVPKDTNGLADVYEYNVETDKLALISSGVGDEGTWFVDSGGNGRDLFLVSQQSYSRVDTDSLVDLYDARIDGGLPEPPPPPVPCAGDACQGVPSASPTFNTASGFSGLGNVASKPTAASTKKKGKPKKHPAKKHRKKRRATKRSRRSSKLPSHRSGR